MRLMVLTMVLAAASALSSSAGERYAYHGFAPAYPESRPPFPGASRLPYFARERLIRALVDIDTAGNVTRVAAGEPSDSAFVRYAEGWLRSVRFVPATTDGVPSASRLPLMLQYRPGVRHPEFHFPVDSTKAVSDASLFFQATACNGVVPPLLEEFPKYFCSFDRSDTSGAGRYVLLGISLDETGQITEVRTVASTHDAFAEQIKSASLWASFAPLTVHGVPKPTECFLLVWFYREVNYPTSVWRRHELLDRALLDRFRVRLLPDTLGLLATPVPARLDGNHYTLSGPHVALIDTVTALLTIDTAGGVRATRVSVGPGHLYDAVRQLASRMRFYPAVDNHGSWRRFSGLATFFFEGSPSIRIRYHWLTDPK